MKATRAFIFITLSICSGTAYCGPYGDDLARCLVSSTSKEDRINLVRWIFVAMSAHPAVRQMANVTAKDIDNSNRAAAALFTRLLTDSCKEKARLAIQYEGPGTMESSFQILGQVASRDLFSSPEVTQSITTFSRYLDKKRFEPLGIR